MASPSPRQITSQGSNDSLTTLSSEGGDGGTEIDEDEDARSDTDPRATTQGPSSDVDNHSSREEQEGQLGGRISRTPSYRSAGASNSSPQPIDPPQLDFDGLQKTHARLLICQSRFPDIRQRLEKLDPTNASYQQLLLELSVTKA
jgi:hypothetical protein